MAKSSAAQLGYNSRERDAALGFARAHPELESAFKGKVRGEAAPSYSQFRRILKENGWAIPSHGRKRDPSPERQVKERKFIAEGLGRPERAEGDSYRTIYRG
jgi:hypothetical protein